MGTILLMSKMGYQGAAKIGMADGRWLCMCIVVIAKSGDQEAANFRRAHETG